MEQRIIFSIICIMAPAWFFIFARKILDRDLSWKILIALAATLIVFSVGRWMVSSDKSLYFPFPAFVPLYAFCLYRFLSVKFRERFRRAPQETSGMTRPPNEDVLFNFGYVVLTILLPMLMLLPLIKR